MQNNRYAILHSVFKHLAEEGCTLKRATLKAKVKYETVYSMIEASREGRAPAWIVAEYDAAKSRRCDLCNVPLLRAEGVLLPNGPNDRDPLVFCSAACKTEWEEGEV